jgi:hypothetical protein
VAVHRATEGSEDRVVHEERRIARSGIVAIGTLACPSCDAPIALGSALVAPRDLVDCPFCDHHAAARDFLSLGEPTRPARVAVRVTLQVSPS